MKKLLPLVTIILSCACLVTAEEEERRRPGGKEGDRCPDIRKVRMENHKILQKHHQEQKKEIGEFRKSLRDMDPDERIDEILAFRTELHDENVAIHKERHAALIAEIEACEHIPDEVKGDLLSKLKKHHKEAVAFHNKMHKKLVAFLKDLKKSDKTPEEKRDAWKEFQEDMREEMAAWREEHRPERPGRPERPERPEGEKRQKKEGGRRGERKPQAE